MQEVLHPKWNTLLFFKQQLELDPTNVSEVHTVRQLLVLRMNTETDTMVTSHSRSSFQFEIELRTLFLHQLELANLDDIRCMFLDILLCNHKVNTQHTLQFVTIDHQLEVIRFAHDRAVLAEFLVACE